MKYARIVMCAVLALAVSASAYALDSNASRLTNLGEDIRFSVNFAGIQLDYGEIFFDTGGSQVLGQGGALGYIPAALDPTDRGGMFVLYDENRQIVADINTSGQSSEPGVFPNLGAVLTDPKNVIKAFGLGSIDSLQNPNGLPVATPQIRPGGTGDTYQMTFVFRDLELQILSPTAANFNQPAAFAPGVGLLDTGTLLTNFVPGTGVFSIYEDTVTDAYGAPFGIPATPATPGVPAGELPTAFFDPNNTGGNEYFDPQGNSLFRFADPSDPNETEVLRLAHIGGMFAQDFFNADLRGPAFLSNGLPVYHPGLNQDVTMWSGGRSAFSDNDVSLIVTGGSWAGSVLSADPEHGFRITSDIAFGKGQAGQGGSDPGVLPEDPLTFTFQTPLGGGPEIFGGVVIPEPLTILGLLMGGGSLAGYLRKRRS